MIIEKKNNIENTELYKNVIQKKLEMCKRQKG